MKIGIDIHGVVSLYPKEFSHLSQKWMREGHEIHILTGKMKEEAVGELEQAGVVYSDFFSIVDFNLSLGTPMEKLESGWWMDRETWNRAKGEYAATVGLDIHFDNNLEYAPFFPQNTSFVWVREKGFKNLYDLLVKSRLNDV